MCWQYHRIDRPVLVPDYPERDADAAMLAEIAAVPQEPDPPEDRRVPGKGVY